MSYCNVCSAYRFYTHTHTHTLDCHIHLSKGRVISSCGYFHNPGSFGTYSWSVAVMWLSYRSSRPRNIGPKTRSGSWSYI